MFGMFVLHPGSWSCALKFQPQTLTLVRALLSSFDQHLKWPPHIFSWETPKMWHWREPWFFADFPRGNLQLYRIRQGSPFQSVRFMWLLRTLKDIPMESLSQPLWGQVMSRQGAFHMKTVFPSSSHNAAHYDLSYSLNHCPLLSLPVLPLESAELIRSQFPSFHKE